MDPTDLRPAEAPAPAAAAPGTAPAIPWQEWLSRVLAHDTFDEAASSALGGLLQALGCARLSLGLRDGSAGGLRLVAQAEVPLPGAPARGADVAADLAIRRQPLVQAIVDAMSEAAGLRSTIVQPRPPGLPGPAALAHAALMLENGQIPACSVPIVSAGLVRGALLFERRQGFDAASLRAAQQAAAFIGPLLDLRHRAEAPSPVATEAGNRRLPTWRVAATLCGLATAVAAAWPVDFHVVASARVEGVVQRVLAAPVDGMVERVAARVGDGVRDGQVLLAMDHGELRAPFDGVLVSADPAARTGMPVRRGQPLLSLSQVRALRLVAEVAEQDLALLRPGLAMQVVFAADGQAPVSLAVERIASQARQVDGQAVFEVDGPLALDAQDLRPGQRGIARILVDRRALGAVWWLRLSNAGQRLRWRWLS